MVEQPSKSADISHNATRTFHCVYHSVMAKARVSPERIKHSQVRTFSCCHFSWGAMQKTELGMKKKTFLLDRACVSIH